MGSNPIPVVVPCHRVVAADGLGGYSGGTGTEVKRWLLTLEGALPPTLDWDAGLGPDASGRGPRLSGTSASQAVLLRGGQAAVRDVQHPEAALVQRVARGRGRAQYRARSRQQPLQVLPVGADDGGQAVGDDARHQIRGRLRLVIGTALAVGVPTASAGSISSFAPVMRGVRPDRRHAALGGRGDHAAGAVTGQQQRKLVGRGRSLGVQRPVQVVALSTTPWRRPTRAAAVSAARFRRARPRNRPGSAASWG